MPDCLRDYYRLPEPFAAVAVKEVVEKSTGYFKFCKSTLYGPAVGAAISASEAIRDVSADVTLDDGSVCLPFDAEQAIENLRYEAYTNPGKGAHPAKSFAGKAYYFFRPILPVRVRRQLQRVRLNGWRDLKFPNWPVDLTVDKTFENLLLLTLRARQVDQIPFIWFWPGGASSCAIMTHDVETAAGRNFCSSLMDINDAFGIKASFQIVPERRYGVTPDFLHSIRSRGFEVNVQDLNHDAYLFSNREEFLARVAKINAYGREFRASGFRSAVLYRRQEWYDALEFSYDMSVPNVAHLDPQRGGCCTVMPYFVGNVLELPVTTTQDYSLFHILNDHSLGLWKHQCELIMSKHGLMNFIIHPDYITEKAERTTYENLLSYLTQLSVERNVWMPLPGEAAQWWRERSQMKLVKVNGEWQIRGKGKERARIAYASEQDGRLVFSFEREAVEEAVHVNVPLRVRAAVSSRQEVG